MRYAEPSLDPHYEHYLAQSPSKVAQLLRGEQEFLELPDRESEHRWKTCKAENYNEALADVRAAITAMTTAARTLGKVHGPPPHHLLSKPEMAWIDRIGGRDPFSWQEKRSLVTRKKFFRTKVSGLEATVAPIHREVCEMLWRPVPQVTRDWVQKHNWMTPEWGVFAPEYPLEEAARGIEESRQVVWRVLTSVVAELQFPFDTQDWSETYYGIIHRFWRTVREKLDALRWEEPPIPDYLKGSVATVPAEPGNFETVRQWPQARFDSDWEALQQVFCKPESDPCRSRILLGRELAGPTPQHLNRSAFSTHVYVYGPTGTGKTSGVLTPLLTQLIRGSDETNANSAVFGKPAPVLIIDLKGDQALYHTVRLEAQRRGQRFRLLTTDIGLGPDGKRARKTDYFDAFYSLRHLDDFPAAVSSIISQAFEIEQGRGYGADHFSSVYTDALAAALSHPSKPRTWSALVDAIPSSEKLSGLRSKLRLLTYEPVASVLCSHETVPADSLVDMPSVVANREVVYVYIPQGEGGRPSLAVAQLALWGFANALVRFNETTPRRGYAVVDEFQEIAGVNIGRLLKQFRGKDCGSFIIANQSPQDLDGIRYGLSEMMRTEPGIQVCTGIRSSVMLQEFQAMSGETLQYFYEPSIAHTDSESTSDTRSTSSGSGHSLMSQFGFSSGHGTVNGISESFGPFGVWPMASASSSLSTGRSFSDGAGRSEFTASSWSSTEGAGKAESYGMRARAYLAPGLEANHALDISNTPLGALVWIPNNGPNGGRPFGVKLIHSQPLELYRQLLHAPWPRLTEDELAAMQEQPELEAVPSSRDGEFQDNLRDLELDDDL